MKNNKGFTIIELAVSFCMVSVIFILLFQLVLSLKDLYISGNIKTTLLNKQGILTKKIYDDLNEKYLSSVESCGLSCLTFNYSDESTANLIVDPGNKTITYGTYTMELDKESEFGKANVKILTTENPINSILTIDIPIYFKLIEGENFGIKIVKTFNSNTTTISNKIDINKTPVDVTLNGVNTNLVLLKEHDDIKNTDEIGVFVNLFHQEKGMSYTEDNIFKYKNVNNNFSTLSSLSAFKITSDLDEVINLQSDNEQLKNEYQNGYYSLMYFQNNNSKQIIDSELISKGNYMRWYQTSNPANKEATRGYFVNFDKGIVIKNDSCAFNGLSYINNTKSFISGCEGDYYQLGSKNSTIIGATGEINSVELLAEAKDYICKYILSEVIYNDINLKDKFCK